MVDAIRNAFGSVEGKPPSSDEIAAIDPSSIKNLDEILAALDTHRERIRALQETLTINEIEKFAEQMTKAGAALSYSPLVAWASQLAEFAEMFDLDGMATVLGTFDDLRPSPSEN